MNEWMVGKEERARTTTIEDYEARNNERKKGICNEGSLLHFRSVLLEESPTEVTSQ